MLYLDHAATTPLLPEVKEAMCAAMDKFVGNSSAIHTPGHTVHEQIESARKKIAKLINAEPSEIIFTSGATEGNNTVIRTFEGKNIAISDFEHPSVSAPAKKYAKKVLNLQQLKEAQLVSVQLANHELGAIFPVQKYAQQAHNNNALIHTDATQAIGKIPVDVKQLEVDYLTFSGHKFGAPAGTGVLYVKQGAPISNLILGGHQENQHRAGTHNLIGIIGLARAVQYILENDTPALYQKKILPLRNSLGDQIMAEIPNTTLNTFSEEYQTLPNMLNVNFKGAEGESIQLLLDNHDIIVSTGSACASTDGKPSPVLMALYNDAEKAHSSIRFSLGLDTSQADINYLMSVLPGIIKKLQGISTV